MNIRIAMPQDMQGWLNLRSLLWPDCLVGSHIEEIRTQLVAGDRVAFLAEANSGDLAGFIEASLRHYAEGCATHPVGYVEGWLVLPLWRRQGVGAMLIEAAEQWAVKHGCQELASDIEFDNTVSISAHLAVGFIEAARLVHVKKKIDNVSFKAAGT